uniref:Uncharacterized protein n=1 Tax=Oryza sativa subsp. japonica TaxID=39947 RepID=Q6Z915_ORYSJ|nr:hypothetical protein [Oryza sativa Japonica Group]
MEESDLKRSVCVYLIFSVPQLTCRCRAVSLSDFHTSTILCIGYDTTDEKVHRSTRLHRYVQTTTRPIDSSSVMSPPAENIGACVRFAVSNTTRKIFFDGVGLLFSLAEKCENRQQTRNEGRRLWQRRPTTAAPRAAPAFPSPPLPSPKSVRGEEAAAAGATEAAAGRTRGSASAVARGARGAGGGWRRRRWLVPGGGADNEDRDRGDGDDNDAAGWARRP